MTPMSCNTNLVILAGNLTRDPELRYTPQGTAVCSLGIANNQRFSDKSGEAKQRTTFVDATAWEKQAESAAKFLRKGDPVLIEGELLMDQWEKDGQKYSKLTIRANRVQFLSQRPDAGDSRYQGDEQREQTAARAADGPRQQRMPDTRPQAQRTQNGGRF